MAGAEVNRSWDTLMQTVKFGKKVVVTRVNSTRAEGKLLALTGDSVTVEVKKQPVVIERSNVFRLRYADIRKKWTLIGLGIGVGAGLIVGVASGGPSADNGWALIGAGVGALTGAAIPTGPPLYESATPMRTSQDEGRAKF